jgi:phosphoribosylamine--glycine ligase
MERVGILVVSKCLSSAAMLDTFLRSERFRPEFYVVERQSNPFNRSRSRSHAVVPDLDLGAIVSFAKKHRKRLDFGLTDTEDFVVAGGRDLVEREAGVPMICVTKKYAVEGSKADQRALFERIFRGANPRYKTFDPKKYRSPQEALADFKKLTSNAKPFVIKPDAPARGAGVGVWGSDFTSAAGAAAFFLNVLSKGRVVVEERVDGEESSFHAFSDGKHFIPAPLTRDYKRGLNGNRGKLTGGMGSYRGPEDRLPFITQLEWEQLAEAEERAFRHWKGRGSQPGLRGIVLYDAIMHTGRGFKVLERNSRGGNTEVINLLTTLSDDFVDVCQRILDGTLTRLRFRRESSVVTCGVPRSYGLVGARPSPPRPIDLASAYAISKELNASVFPMDVAGADGTVLSGTSRTVAATGLGLGTEEARELSLKVLAPLAGSLRWRTDIASATDIAKSAAKMKRLRAASA